VGLDLRIPAGQCPRRLPPPTPSEEAWRQLRLRYRLAAQTGDTYYEAGFSVAVQDVVIAPLLTTYVNGIRARRLVVVVLAPRPEVVARREAARTKVAYRDDAATITALSALRQETLGSNCAASPLRGLRQGSRARSGAQPAADVVDHDEGMAALVRAPCKHRALCGQGGSHPPSSRSPY
jgi:hypothetical protein